MNEASLDSTGRCAVCREGTAGFDAAYSFGAYDGALRDLIHLLKYSKIRTLAKPLGRFLGRALPRDERFDLVLPVPMHWRKRWDRGFNQSELLARAVARRAGVRIWNSLARRRRSIAQAGLTLAERRTNMENAFRLKSRARAEVAGKRILLVDDVFTTGATAAACARTLKSAGAVSVVLLTLARVDRRWADGSVAESIPGASA